MCVAFYLRFVCISDTHSLTDEMPTAIPNGDILLHAGDFTCRGHIEEIEKFNKFLGKVAR